MNIYPLKLTPKTYILLTNEVSFFTNIHIFLRSYVFVILVPTKTLPTI